jgi:hypothetical protein
MALSSVDGFLRPFKKNETLQPDTQFKLEIEFVELSASDKALWLFRRPKIEQYIADLGRLKLELMLLLLIISLAKTEPISTEYDIQTLSRLYADTGPLQEGYFALDTRNRRCNYIGGRDILH